MGQFRVTDEAIRRLHAHDLVIRIALRIPDEELARAILDLARTARREMSVMGFSPAYTEAPVTGYEMMLTQHVMPEIAARLSADSPTPLIRSKDELGDGRICRMSAAELRRVAGLCWSKSDFGRIGAAVRSRFDPSGSQADQVFATEVIGQEPSNGNILEIALTRAAPVSVPEPTRKTDWFADRILTTARARGVTDPLPYWTPELRQPLPPPPYALPSDSEPVPG
jgi:hypothetical protein